MLDRKYWFSVVTHATIIESIHDTSTHFQVQWSNGETTSNTTRQTQLLKKSTWKMVWLLYNLFISNSFIFKTNTQFIRLQEDADARSSAQQAAGNMYTNMAPPMAPPPHHYGNSSAMVANRRQSEDPSRRFTRTPLPQEIPGNGIRRASDPVKRPSQQVRFDSPLLRVFAYNKLKVVIAVAVDPAWYLRAYDATHHM